MIRGFNKSIFEEKFIKEKGFDMVLCYKNKKK